MTKPHIFWISLGVVLQALFSVSTAFSLSQPYRVRTPLATIHPTATGIASANYPSLLTTNVCRAPTKLRSQEEDESETEEESSLSEEESSLSEVEETVESLNRWQRLKRKIIPSNSEFEGLTFRQKLTKAGLSVLLSYGWVSNASFAVTFSLAWYIHCKRTLLSPLVPGQWKKFLAVYAGFYVFNSIIRPIRFGLALSISFYLEKLVAAIQKRLKVKKGVAIALTVIFLNVFGTTVLFALGILLASTAAGIPIFP